MAFAAVERAFVRDRMNRYERAAMRSHWNAIATAHVEDKEDRALVDAEFAKYANDPVGFCRDYLNVDLWEAQIAIATSVAQHGQTAAKTGHKIGKSLLAACLALWWVCTRPLATVIITAPSAHQVKGIVWKELRELHKRIRDRVGGVMPLDPLTGLKLSNGSEIRGLATNTPERVAGLSGRAVFVIIDEASGYEDRLYEALETSTAGGDDELEGAGEARILAIGNPTKTSGWFFEIFRTANQDWQRHTVSSEQTPNVLAANDNGRADIKPVRGLATKAFIDKLRRKYGPNPDTHPIYMVRVLGEYPEHSSASVVPMRSVERAMSPKRHKEIFVRKHGIVDLGVDVARFGDDDSVIASRIDDWIAPLEVFSGIDGVELAHHVERTARAWIAKGYSRVRVKVDGNGVGSSVLDTLVRCELAMKGQLVVYDVQAAGKPSEEGEYINVRAEMWFKAKEWLEGGALPEDSELSRDFLAPEYFMSPKNLIQVHSKEQMKKKIGRSPDRADAVCLAIYEGNIVEFTFRSGREVESSTVSPTGRYRMRKGGGAL